MEKISQLGQHEIKSVVHISREYASLAGAGGIKDVTEGLCRASAARGIDTHVFLPYYRAIRKKPQLDIAPSVSIEVPMRYKDGKDRHENVDIHSFQPEPRLTIHLIHSIRYDFLEERDWTIERNGIYLYEEAEAAALGDPALKGKGYRDFFAMNVLLVKATLLALTRISLVPDVVHCHDGHAALFPLIAQASTLQVAPLLPHVPCVVTIHNAGMGFHQEIKDWEFASSLCDVSPSVVAGCLLNDNFDPLLAGGVFGSVINTVSENYARELVTTGQDVATGWLGHRLAGYGVQLLGVTNGIDPEPYNPERGADIGLMSKFSVRRGEFEGKQECKKATLKALALRKVSDRVILYGSIDHNHDCPLLTFVGRLDRQKGFDVLATAIQELFDHDSEVQLVGLGDGDPEIQKIFIHLSGKFEGRICLAQGYNPLLATQIYAAGDFFVIPSRFEPCGLTDFMAQLMGNVPIVHRVGGLVKTLDDRYGFSYLGGSTELLEAIRRGLSAYRESGKERLRRIQRAAVSNIEENFTWDKVLAKKYLPLYSAAIARSQPKLPYDTPGVADSPRSPATERRRAASGTTGS